MILVHFHRYDCCVLCIIFLSRLYKSNFQFKTKAFLICLKITDHFVALFFLFSLREWCPNLISRWNLAKTEEGRNNITQSCQFSMSHSQNDIYLFWQPLTNLNSDYGTFMVFCSLSSVLPLFVTSHITSLPGMVFVYIIIKFNQIWDLFSDMCWSPEYLQTPQCQFDTMMPMSLYEVLSSNFKFSKGLEN